MPAYSIYVIRLLSSLFAPIQDCARPGKFLNVLDGAEALVPQHKDFAAAVKQGGCHGTQWGASDFSAG
jgi:hypothetical protein